MAVKIKNLNPDDIAVIDELEQLTDRVRMQASRMGAQDLLPDAGQAKGVSQSGTCLG